MNDKHVALVRDKRKLAEWRKGNPTEVLDLSYADLADVNLVDADLSEADFFCAHLENADFSGAILSDADLTNANLSNAYLDNANLSNANLTNAILSCVDLTKANFECRIGFTNFAGTNIDKIVGQPIHLFPSYIDQTTLQKLCGNITPHIDQFLRGCGLEKWEIESARLHQPGLTPEQISDHLTTKVFPLLTPGNILGGVFLSYAHLNQEFVDKLYENLKEHDVQTYIDKHDFTPGPIAKNISRAIRYNDRVVLVLSKESLRSDWVWDEIESTFEKEKKMDGKCVLFPIAIDDAWLEDPPEEKRHLMRKMKLRLVPDFSNPRNFKKEFQKLLTGMKVNHH